MPGLDRARGRRYVGGVGEHVTWWGEVDIPRGKAGLFRIGPLELAVQHREGEWRLCRVFHPDDGVVHVTVPVDVTDPSPDARVSRHATTRAGDRVRLSPVLPDRPVVTKPEHPVSVPPHDEATMYVGSPLWVRAARVDPDGALEDLPCLPPLSTWWGRDTLAGELCYATRTWGRLHMDQLEVHPHRVITEVRIKNRDDTPLWFDRLYLPVARLSVFADEHERLWTESVTLDRDAGDDASLVVGKAPKKMQKLGEPRDAGAHPLFRAFGSLFK